MARVLLIVGGGIAAYKSLELVRLMKKAGHEVTPVLTKGGEHFVTAMSLGTLAESQVHTSVWELKDEVEIGHIQLSRAAALLLVCRAAPRCSRRRSRTAWGRCNVGGGAGRKGSAGWRGWDRCGDGRAVGGRGGGVAARRRGHTRRRGGGLAGAALAVQVQEGRRSAP